MRKRGYLFLMLFCSFSCIGEFPIELPFGEPQLIVDAFINSKLNESYIEIGWTSPVGQGCYSYGSPVPCPPDNDVSGGTYLVNGMITLEEEAGETYTYSVSMHDRKGYIHISMPEIAGVPGKKYTLNIDIMYNDETTHYSSETRMLITPTIDQVDYEIRKGDVGKNDNFVPLIYFKEPQQEKNYYLFRICQATGGSPNCGFNSRVWPYSVISDEFLPEDVKGLSIDDGASVAKYAEFYPHVYPGVGAHVKMYSVEKETYEFYKSLLQQFDNDGGTFSPSPYQFKGNISGGAIGIFRAVEESTGEVYM